ncbi:MAG: Smr/MutS family protein [Xanthomonadales bacterium]|nr:Smr/MutS family protein [Xanthomonadales bacterium]
MTKPKDEACDFELFRESVGDVRPLRQPLRSDSRAPRPRPTPTQSRLDEQAVVAELLSAPLDPAEIESGEELVFLRPGYQKRYLRRLRRGQYSIEDSIDLHTMNESAASASIVSFVESSVGRGHGCIRIVHGKGLRSKNGPKLKRLTQRLLSRHPAVIAFASCRPQDGGTGAVAVLLRNRKRAPAT